MQKKIQAHMVDYPNMKQSGTMADSNFDKSQSNFTKNRGLISQSPRNSEDEVFSPSSKDIDGQPNFNHTKAATKNKSDH